MIDRDDQVNVGQGERVKAAALKVHLREEHDETSDLSDFNASELRDLHRGYHRMDQ